MECNKTCAWGCCDSEEKKNCKKCKFLPIFFSKNLGTREFSQVVINTMIFASIKTIPHMTFILYHMSEIRTHSS